MKADGIIRGGERRVVMNANALVILRKCERKKKVYVIDSKRSGVTGKVKNVCE